MIAPGVTVGHDALVAIGAVVVRDVLPYALVAGNPARQCGWVCTCGRTLADTLRCPRCSRGYIRHGDELHLLGDPRTPAMGDGPPGHPFGVRGVAGVRLPPWLASVARHESSPATSCRILRQPAEKHHRCRCHPARRARPDPARAAQLPHRHLGNSRRRAGARRIPWQAACREIKEELGLDLEPGRLLVLDWVPPQPDGRPALANFLFDGGRITQNQAEQRVSLQTDELSEWRLTGPQQWDELMAPHMARRLRACADALRTQSTAYLHHGWDPANPAH
ncbi:hypothetical protein GCM10027614_40740 [Micromonospora vulcania]